MAKVVTVHHKPREAFAPYYDRTQRWAVLVAHRRAGKTYACVADLMLRALMAKRPDSRFSYISPFFAQSKDVAWPYVRRFGESIPGAKTHESELRVDLPNGARVRLYGADNYDRMRGGYLDGVVLDEYADFDPRAWSEVVRPMLSDRSGWATFIGTPKGRNAFWEVYDRAQRSEDWFTAFLPASVTGILAPAELDSARMEMSDEQYRQEYECSFQAAIPGAYYGKEIEAAEREGRIGNVAIDPGVAVDTYWDLGVADSTAIWFVQTVGREIRVVDFYQASGYGLDHYARVLNEKKYAYGEHWAPHDIKVRELGTGKSRLETARSLGINFRETPDIPLEDGINAARRILGRAWFDVTRTGHGLECLRQYQTEFDDKLKVFKRKPRHDWTSHAADAFRYMAVAHRDPVKVAPMAYEPPVFFDS